MAVYNGPVSSGRNLQLRTASTQDAVTNASSVTIELWMVSTNDSIRYSDKMGVGIALNGWQAFWWQGQASYGAGTYILASSTHSIAHDANGDATIQLAGAVSDTGVDLLTVGNVWEALPNIPRGTTPNIGGGSFITGASTTINLPRLNSSYTHDVSYKFGTKTGVIATGVGVTTAWTPDHTLLEVIPNAASNAWLEITVVTKAGSTVIATKKVYFTLTAGTSVVPAVASVLWDDANPVVKAAIGAFVQGQSLVKGTVVAEGVYGSTIKSKRLTIAGSAITEAQVWEPATSGTITASGQATDSRDRVGVKAANFTVLAYAKPTLPTATVRRATTSAGVVGEGAYLRMDLTAAVQSLMVGTQKNALKLLVKTRPIGGAWTTRNNLTHTALSYTNALIMVTGGAVFPINTSFEVEITISDNLGQSATVTKLIGTGGASFDIARTGTGHGKIWERGGVDAAGTVFTDTGFSVLSAGKTTTLNGAGITSPDVFAINPRSTRPGNTFTLKSQLDTWTTAPNGTVAWVEAEGCEYIRKGGVWKTTALGYAGLTLVGSTWDSGGGIFGGGTQTTINASGATIGARRITPTIAGRWRATLNGVWADNSTGLREAALGRNGVSMGATDAPGNAAGLLVPAQSRSEYSLSFDTVMNGTTDYITFSLYQNSGVRLTNTWTSLTLQQLS